MKKTADRGPTSDKKKTQKMKSKDGKHVLDFRRLNEKDNFLIIDDKDIDDNIDDQKNKKILDFSSRKSKPSFIDEPSLGKRNSPGRTSLEMSTFYFGLKSQRKSNEQTEIKRENRFDEVDELDALLEAHKNRESKIVQSGNTQESKKIQNETINYRLQSKNDDYLDLAEMLAVETSKKNTPEVRKIREVRKETETIEESDTMCIPMTSTAINQKIIEQTTIMKRGRGRPRKYMYGSGNPPPFIVVRPTPIHELREMKNKEKERAKAEVKERKTRIRGIERDNHKGSAKNEEKTKEEGSSSSDESSEAGSVLKKQLRKTTIVKVTTPAVHPLCILQQEPPPNELVNSLLDALNKNLEETKKLHSFMDQNKEKESLDSVLAKAVLETGSRNTLKKILKWTMKNCRPEMTKKVEKKLGLRLKKKTLAEFENEQPPELKPINKPTAQASKVKSSIQKVSEDDLEEYPNLMINRALLDIGKDIDTLMANAHRNQ